MRMILAVFVGLLGAVGLMRLVERGRDLVFSPARPGAVVPALQADTNKLVLRDVNASDPAATAPFLADPPLGALFFVLGGWALGTICGSACSVVVARSNSLMPVWILGAILLAFGIWNNAELHPAAWYWAATLIVFRASGYLGTRIGRAIENHERKSTNGE